MKNGLDRHADEASNVVSLAGARKRTAKGTAQSAGDVVTRRLSAGQWLTSALFMVLAVGGVIALAAPLLRAIGIMGG